MVMAEVAVARVRLSPGAPASLVVTDRKREGTAVGDSAEGCLRLYGGCAVMLTSEW